LARKWEDGGRRSRSGRAGGHGLGDRLFWLHRLRMGDFILRFKRSLNLQRKEGYAPGVGRRDLFQTSKFWFTMLEESLLWMGRGEEGGR